MPEHLMVTPRQYGALAFLPLASFVLLFLGAGLYYQSLGVDYAFYQLPAHIAVLPALVIAMLLHRTSMQQAVETLIRGAGQNTILTMCLIYLLAGAFSSVAVATGGVDAVVNAGLSLVPPSLLVPGLFLIAALIALAMGTSMGTIGALAPIAVVLAEQTGLSPVLLAGALLGGAMFGDNLSIISDTTIASTRTQGARMKDKFRENLKLALPAAAVVLFGYIWFGSVPAEINPQAFSWSAVLPYAAILVLAVAGLNVFAVLSLGIVLAALQGAFFGDYPLGSLGQDMASGFASMQEIFLLSMFIGGLGEFIKQQGGLGWLSSRLSAFFDKVKMRAERSGQLGIASLVFGTNLCVANNTVAIVISGDISRKLAENHGITPKRSASLLDIFACISQGLLPYGAQALLLAASFGLSPWQVVSASFYCMALAVVALLWLLLKPITASSPDLQQ
ncbi:Na+/H+ antiporter NhaC family protein [Alkalimonas sp. MEB108]|uniref:Na+/H+ antiporter NhaC family protein n=1 Tax=Alkalimonas cellulosilytica TaxID=3058395 RepID=A0ABU7J1C6_9GAMM|nr:Na+/H+ antiporter NhaC family protein [Alkalimonas sp. MEB108]MEE2000214.1 Na+/H+ antiporter NhaC family protein [Alkalimonas sp. MEB108]